MTSSIYADQADREQRHALAAAYGGIAAPPRVRTVPTAPPQIIAQACVHPTLAYLDHFRAPTGEYVRRRWETSVFVAQRDVWDEASRTLLVYGFERVYRFDVWERVPPDGGGAAEDGGGTDAGRAEQHHQHQQQQQWPHVPNGQ